MRDHKNKDDQQKIEHETLISLEEEHAKLKRKLNAVRNGKVEEDWDEVGAKISQLED